MPSDLNKSPVKSMCTSTYGCIQIIHNNLQLWFFREFILCDHIKMSLPLPSSQKRETNLLQWSFSGCGCTWQLPGVNSCNCACRAFLERAFMFFGPVKKDWLNQQPVCFHASKVTWALTNYKTVFFLTH